MTYKTFRQFCSRGMRSVLNFSTTWITRVIFLKKYWSDPLWIWLYQFMKNRFTCLYFSVLYRWFCPNKSKIRINFSFKSRTRRFHRILPPLANKIRRQMVCSECIHRWITSIIIMIYGLQYNMVYLNCREVLRVMNSRIVWLRICPLLNISKSNQFGT